MLSSPEILIFDEPTANLDPISRKKLLSFIRLNYISAIIITQRVDEAEDFCDKIAFLSDGKFLLHDTPANLISSYAGVKYVRVTPAAPIAQI